MIIEDKKETCHPACRIDLRIAVSHKFVGLHPTYKNSCHSELVSESHKKVDRQFKEEIPEQVRNDMNKQQTLSRICKLAFGSLTNSTPVLKLHHAHRVSPKLLRNRRLNLFAIRINSLSLNHPSAISLSQRERVCRKAAFTLAEVLITLGIIGVVAAMTMPTLIQKHQERVTVNKVKKFYSVMSQAQLMAIKDHGYLDEWDVPDGFSKASAEKFASYLTPYLKIAKDCGTDSGCLQNGNIKLLNGNGWNNYESDSRYYKLILIDGTYMWFRTAESTYCHTSDGSIAYTCGVLWVDINGKNPPNTVGKDIFTFYVTKNSIKTSENDTCNSSSGGWSCARYILEQGNMDYLKNN